MKEICNKCGYWTKNPKHDKYRCRIGSCPDVVRSCGPEYKDLDQLVKDNKETIEMLHKRFLEWDDVEKHWMCTCPLCRSLEIGGDCQ